MSRNINHLKRLFGLKRGVRLDRVFGYDRPVWEAQGFFPRDSLARKLVDYVKEPGTQLLVFGELHVGKTSLIRHCLARMRRPSVAVECSGDMTEEDLIRRILHHLIQNGFHRITGNPPSPKQNDDVASIAEPRVGLRRPPLSPWAEPWKSWIKTPSISCLIDVTADSRIVLFVDNTERLRGNRVLNCLGDLAKGLSDRGTDALAGKLVLSVVAANPSRIPDSLRSSRNRIRPIMIPRMSCKEIEGLIRQGMFFSFLKLTKPVVREIVRLSQGIPATAKLLCLEAGRAVAKRAGIEDQRLSGGECEVHLDWFQNEILPNLPTEDLHLTSRG